ncbi:MAG: 5'-nucleotidase C-terminal domain-containing protein [Rhodobacteraceae bacterium]|nr:5'-nucleotidase C-terminal domain-containing protein [Paracoccaceae bacterium]
MFLRRSLPLAAVVATGLGGQAEAFTLHVLHFNDFHSRIESINKYDSTCSGEDEAEGACFGGAARLYTAIHSLRDDLKAAGENVIVLNAGDNFQGSLFFTTYSGKAELEFMNAIGLDAMVLGNHEFDLGPGPLGDFIEGAEFPVIFGNVDASADKQLGPLDHDPLLLEVGDETIAILGALTTDTPQISSPGPTVSFADTAAYLGAAARNLEEQGVDKIIVLSHVGAVADHRLAETVAGIDAIVGGHSHTLYANDLDGAAYPYPDMVAGPDGAGVPIVQAGAYSKYLGHLVLEFDAEGNVISATGAPVLLDASVLPDPDMLKRIKSMGAPIKELKARVVAEVAGDIDGSRETCRAGECAMGDLVADAMLDRVKGQGVTIAIQNGGGLRASIGAGKVTMGDVLTVLPFQNTLSTFNLSGAGIVAALENGVSQVEEEAGRFPQVAGLRFTWDADIAPMEGRVTEVMVQEGGAWVPINPDKVYSVATNNFMRSGGDGYVVFRDEGRNAYDYGPGLEDVLADYLQKHPGYAPAADDRITRVN